MSMSVAEAARKWGVSTTTVKKWIAEGRLQVERIPWPTGFAFVVLDQDRPEPRQRGAGRK